MGKGWSLKQTKSRLILQEWKRAAEAMCTVWGLDSSLFPFYKAAGSPHSGYTYIYRRLLYWSYTEGRGSILHRLQKTTLIEPHLQVSEISRERKGWGGNSTREEGSEGRGEMMQSESLTRLPNNLTLEKTYRFHAQCILNRSREEPFTINICIFREPTYIKKWLKKKQLLFSLFLFFSLLIFSFPSSANRSFASSSCGAGAFLAPPRCG